MELISASNSTSQLECVVNIVLIEVPNIPSNNNVSVICDLLPNSHMSIDWPMLLNDTIHKVQLIIFRLTSNSKNAVNLCNYVYPQMISKDLHLNQIVNVLKNHKCSAEHLGICLEKKALSQQRIRNNISAPVKNVITDFVKFYCEHIITYMNNRLFQQTSLINSIKSKLSEDNKPTESALTG